MLLRLWKIEKNCKTVARKINWINIIISILIGCVTLYFFSSDALIVFFITYGSYFILSYILLGVFKCYKVKYFKGHRMMRWVCLGFIILYELFVLVMFLVKKDMAFFYVLAVAIPVLLCSVQCVRNGYRDEE